MGKVGEVLRQQRESRSLSLEDVRSALGIPLHYLQAMENGKSRLVADEFYLIPFLRRYAEFLDLMKQGTVDFALELQKLVEAGDVKKFFRQAYKSQRELITLADSAQALGMKVCGAREVPQSSTGN